MRGRGGGGDPEFGSDAFLDIIANLVGILIILIVLAGLRAGTAPDEPVPDITDIAAQDAMDSSAADPLLADDSAAAESPETAQADAHPESLAQDIFDDDPSRPLAADVQQQIASLHADAQRLLSAVNAVSTDDTQRDLESVQASLARQASRIRELQATYQQEQTTVDQRTRLMQQADAKYRELRVQLVDANDLLEELARKKPRTEQLDLRINPVGRRAGEDEIAFRIEAGRVTHIPVKDLFEQALTRERHNTALLLRHEAAHGTAGPIEGILMEYRLGVSQRLVSNGRGGQAWSAAPDISGIIRMTNAAPSESTERSIQEGGLVTRVLLQAPPEATIRLFVGTDEFKAARELSRFMRDRGFRVAAVPVEPGSDLPVHLGNRSDAIVQ